MYTNDGQQNDQDTDESYDESLEQAMQEHKELIERTTKALAPLAQALDPNWLYVCIEHERGELHARINGPAKGDQVMSTPVEQLLPPEFIEHVRFDGHGLVFNRDHQITPKVGEVIIEFENIEDGYITSVSESGFKVKRLESERVVDYTVRELAAELDRDDSFEDGCADRMHYCPCHLISSVFRVVALRNGQELELAYHLWADRYPGGMHVGESLEEFGPRLVKAIQELRERTPPSTS